MLDGLLVGRRARKECGHDEATGYQTPQTETTTCRIGYRPQTNLRSFYTNDKRNAVNFNPTRNTTRES